MQQPHTKLYTILLIDGIAIFFIVLLHSIDPLNSPINYLRSYLIAMGLSLFTFSAGYKLMINHSDTLDQRIFLSKYYIKRFIRLYKPYIGYTLLTVFPLLIVIYIAEHFFLLVLVNPKLSIFTTINNESILSSLNFLCGINPIAPQLWYLVTLIVITSICFTILYFLNIKWLFFSFIPFFLISLLIKFEIISNIDTLQVFAFLPFFILGSYWAYNQQQYQTAKWLKMANFYFPTVFLILIISTTIISQTVIYKSILIYFSCFLFPFFILSIFDYVKKIKFLYPFLMLCGAYSFQIYLFHLPLVLPILLKIIIQIFKIDYFYIEILIAVLTIYCCVIVYKIVKKVHLNFLFE